MTDNIIHSPGPIPQDGYEQTRCGISARLLPGGLLGRTRSISSNYTKVTCQGCLVELSDSFRARVRLVEERIQNLQGGE